MDAWAFNRSVDLGCLAWKVILRLICTLIQEQLWVHFYWHCHFFFGVVAWSLQKTIVIVPLGLLNNLQLFKMCSKVYKFCDTCLMCYDFVFDFWCASNERCNFPQLKIYLERGVCRVHQVAGHPRMQSWPAKLRET